MHQIAGFIDLQTEADRSTQRCIVSSLQKQFPNVQIVGEEVAAFSLFRQTSVLFYQPVIKIISIDVFGVILFFLLCSSLRQ